jgi:hypothetical protein
MGGKKDEKKFGWRGIQTSVIASPPEAGVAISFLSLRGFPKGKPWQSRLLRQRKRLLRRFRSSQ